MAKSKVTFPTIVHVRRDYDGKESWLAAFENGIFGAVDEDGPTEVAEYKLVRIVKATKHLQFDEVE